MLESGRSIKCTVGELSPAEVRGLMARGAIYLVDVREPFEFAAGHIQGATNQPLSDFAQGAPRLPTDRPIVLYCLSGARSARALGIGAALGVPLEKHLAGGIKAWIAEGLPITS